MGNLVNKICDVIKEIGVVPKTGLNKFQGYNYRKHEDIMSHLQPTLLKHGLVFYPKSKSIHEVSVIEKTNKSGDITKNIHVLMVATYTMTDGESSIDFMGLGEGIDNGDKAIYKAQTGAIKYALNDLLMLASESDPENDQHESSNTTKSTKPTQTPSVDNTDNETAIIDLCKEKGKSPKVYLTKAKALGYEKVINELKGS